MLASTQMPLCQLCYITHKVHFDAHFEPLQKQCLLEKAKFGKNPQPFKNPQRVYIHFWVGLVFRQWQMEKGCCFQLLKFSSKFWGNMNTNKSYQNKSKHFYLNFSHKPLYCVSTAKVFWNFSVNSNNLPSFLNRKKTMECWICCLFCYAVTRTRQTQQSEDFYPQVWACNNRENSINCANLGTSGSFPLWTSFGEL